jgi:hypothetical protein
MKAKVKYFTMTFFLGLFLVSQAFSQTMESAGQQSSNPEMDAMMQKWMEAAAPNEHHKLLDQFVGKWSVVTKMWMEGPDKPATESKGSSEIKWTMDGRFLQENVTGESMGRPMIGMGYTGYDNFKKKYVSFWIDNMNTAMFTSMGDSDPSGKVFTFYGLMDEPMTGEKDKKAKYVMRVIDKDKNITEIYDLGYGDKEAKVVEITYKRM